MWKNDNFFEVSVEERLELNYKLELAYKSRGVSFGVDYIEEPTICYMNYDEIHNEFSFGCGSFWFEERNILPVIAMTHELGHYVDVRDNFNLDIKEYHTTLGLRELELRAWLYAVDICREIGFNRWDVFYKYARQCLVCYYLGFFGWLDFRFGFTPHNPDLENAFMRLEDKIGLNKIISEM